MGTSQNVKAMQGGRASLEFSCLKKKPFARKCFTSRISNAGTA